MGIWLLLIHRDDLDIHALHKINTEFDRNILCLASLLMITMTQHGYQLCTLGIKAVKVRLLPEQSRLWTGIWKSTRKRPKENCEPANGTTVVDNELDLIISEEVTLVATEIASQYISS